MAGTFDVYDTTLRDGAQQEGLSLSVVDKLAIARHLDELGVGYIEGGWPGRRVAPKAASVALASDSSDRARAKNSVSLGLAPGQPPSM